MGRCPVWLEADIARIDCKHCGAVRTEVVPWARPGARLARDLEDLIAWLAQRTDKSSICRLLRVSWQAVHRTVTRLVADHLDDTRLDNLYPYQGLCKVPECRFCGLLMPGSGRTRVASRALPRRAAVMLRHRERAGCLVRA
jgi:Helix-turn-helix domain of transposase family ISL3